MEKQTDLLIMGDSWGLGEWGWDLSGTYSVLHPGLGQYVSEAGHSVVNISRGSDSNRSQVDALLSYLATTSLPHRIIWFVTDPLRDFDGYMSKTYNEQIANFFAPLQTLQQYQLAKDQLLRLQLERVKDLGVWLIGGVQPLPHWVSSEFPGLCVLCSDLRRWLIPTYDLVDGPYIVRTWQYPDVSPALAEYFTLQERLFERHCHRVRDTHSLEHRYFHPDNVHPNRQAHHCLAHELILPQL